MQLKYFRYHFLMILYFTLSIYFTSTIENLYLRCLIYFFTILSGAAFLAFIMLRTLSWKLITNFASMIFLLVSSVLLNIVVILELLNHYLSGTSKIILKLGLDVCVLILLGLIYKHISLYRLRKLDNNCLESLIRYPDFQVDATIFHLTDMHLPERATLEENLDTGQPYTQAECLEGLRQALLNVDVSLLNCLLVGGDLSDFGKRAEYELFFGELDQSLLDILMIIPGNHDLALNPNFYPSSSNNDFPVRAVTFLEALSLLPLSNWHCLINDRVVPIREILSSLTSTFGFYRHYFDSNRRDKGVRKSALETLHSNWQWSELPKLRKDEDVFRFIFQHLYPMFINFTEESSLVVLNSCTRNNFSIYDCGFGECGTEQIKKLVYLLNSDHIHLNNLVIALHHHIGIPQSELRGKSVRFKFEHAGLGLVDAKQLLSAINHCKNVKLIHGHLHFTFASRDHGVLTVSAPSSTFSSNGPKALLYHFAASGDMSITEVI